MGIRIIIAISLGFVLTSAQAGTTNSWQNSLDYYWEDPPSWSAGAPSLNDSANFITNAASKTVTLDDSDTGSYQSTLTISNLTVAGAGNATNTLYLFNGGTTVPLRILNSLYIGNGGVLQMTNAFLRVDETNSTFQIDGTLQILNRAKVQARTLALGSGAVLRFAVGSNSSPVAVSNNLTVAGTLNVTDGGGFTTNTYTLFTYGGTLTDNGLTLGTTPSNASCVIDTATFGQVNLVVNSIPSPLTAFQQWQLQYFGCTNPVTCPQAAGDADPDGDGMSNTNEFLAGFNPTNNAAYLHVISVVKTNSDMSITYLGADGNPPITSRTNVLEFTTGAPNGSYSNNFVSTGQINILSGGTGVGIVTNMVDTGGASGPSRFYRVRVLVP